MKTNEDDGIFANRLTADAAGGAQHQEDERVCPACGASARRAEARYCGVCGRRFDTNDYLPSDALRSSYHYQRKGLPATVLAASEAGRQVRASRPKVGVMPFQKNNNSASTTALAFVTYALVPYLGILFCPGALLMGGIGFVVAHRAPERGGRRASVLGIVFGLLILGVQIFLWWLLYKVPEWSHGG
ncbi:MAG TPA: zinc ribbon domain-containing protein [Pyrinomonadaceae bacterium]|jgi:hypothetical protein